jgi:pimeloyl-ACP methyl ester carboxylesterase
MTAATALGEPPRRIRIPCPRFDLSALDYGNVEAPPMLLVHGMRDLAWSMDCIAQAFRDRFHVVALDLRGHGDSGQPGYYAIPHFVSDIHTILTKQGLSRPILIGHSFGGEVVSQFAGTFPEVPRACVLIEGLGPPPWEGEGSEAIRKQMARSSVEDQHTIEPEGRQVPDLDTAVERLRAAHPSLGSDHARFLAAEGTRAHSRGGLRWKWDPYLRTMWGSFSRDMMEERWSWVECPVHVVMGGQSASWWSRGPRAKPVKPVSGSYLPAPELARRLELFSNASCSEIAEAGHMVHFDQPEALNAAIESFLAESVPATTP